MQLAYKTVAITGGTDGIGREIARAMALRGARVIVIGRRPELLDAASREGLIPLQADLSLQSGCDAAIAELAACGIDILVNNAGIDPLFDALGAIDVGAVDRAIYLNLNAPIRIIAGVLPSLLAKSEAAIVNVTSGLAIAPSADTPVYCGTKAGLRSFTMALRAQLRNTRVKVVEALPPMVDTAMTKSIEKRGKMPAADCAAAIVAALIHDRDEANIGEVAMLRRIYSLSPAIARRIMRDS